MPPHATGTADVLADEVVVDVDVHLTVPEEELAEYADPPHDDYLRAPKVQLKSPGWDPTMGGKIESRDLLSVDQLESELVEGMGVDHPVLNSFVNLSRLSQVDAAVALQRAANDHLLDRFLDDTDHRGLMSVQTQKPEAAAEEIDRVGDEDGIVGVFLPSTGPSPPLGDPEYDVMYRAMEDRGLTPVFHGATNSGFDVAFPKQNAEFRKFVEAHVNAHLWSQTMTLTSTLAHGLPEKFPDLDLVFLEAGIAFVPYMMWRLNKEFAMRGSEVPLAEKRPEEYVRERCYFASQPLGEPMDPDHMRTMIDLIGTDSLLFASDYPHWDFDHPDELGAYLRETFDDDEREAVLSGNAGEAFDLGL
ncbi:MAG: amidohydrolase family protein [Haloferacaceae archaeon]